VPLPFSLELRPAGDSRFELRSSPATGGRLLGGGLLAASVLSSAQTVDPDRMPASLHASFLRAGRVGATCWIDISAIHDGQSSSVREVSVLQDQRQLATLTLRYHTEAEPAPSPWSHAEREGAAGPDQGRADEAAVASLEVLDGFEIRAAVLPGSVERPLLHPFWVRSCARIGDDPVAHAATLAFLSDIGVSGSALEPAARMRRRLEAVTLDHLLTWYGPVRVDEWVRIEASPVVNAEGRGLANGEIRTEGGRLIAALTQHVLLGAGAR
jgi:acyl-CoA thioesterase II